VARGIDVTLFATQDSRQRASWPAFCPAPYSEDPAIDAKVWEMLHVAHVLRARGRIRPHSQPGRFRAARLLAAGGNAIGDDDPRLLFGTHPACLQGVRRSRPLCRDQPTPTAIRTCAMRRRSTTVSGWRTFRSTRTAARPALLRPHPTRTKGRPRLSRRHVERVGGWSWPASSRIRTIITSKSRPRSTTVPWSIAARWRAARTKALGSARALLHLINFDEPFGLSVVEALACGTPVIASNRGSMPELVDLA